MFLFIIVLTYSSSLEIPCEPDSSWALITVVTFGSVFVIIFAGNRVASCSLGGVEAFTRSLIGEP